MPRFPSLSGPAQALPPSVFDRLMARLARYRGQVIQLQIGDTHVAPPEASRLGRLDFPSGPDPELYRYSPAQGKQRLVEAVVGKLRGKNRLAHVATDNVQITAGATHALSCAVRALLDPGDHVLLLAPYWSLMRGISISCGVRPVDVPFSQVLLRNPAADVEALIEPFVTPNTAAIYVCTPNNPDGKVLTRDELGAIARVAQRHDLWVMADEVYEDAIYDGRDHVSIGGLPGMENRTITVFSFSKSYGQAGLRVGYAVGPAASIAAIRRLSNHTVYCVPRAMQRASLAALEHGADYLVQTRDRYREARDLAHARLGDLALSPQGATYLWLDLEARRRPHEEDATGVIERIADDGVLLAPGGAFGHAYRGWARLCFTSVTRPMLEEGIERVRRVIDAG